MVAVSASSMRGELALGIDPNVLAATRLPISYLVGRLQLPAPTCRFSICEIMEQPMDHASRRLLLLAIVACVAMIYLYPLTLPTPLLDPDEGLHASIAQEMVERGDYVIPRFCGEPFRDKPIVYFVAEAASLRLFGMNEAAVRLPGMLFSLLGCVTTGLHRVAAV